MKQKAIATLVVISICLLAAGSGAENTPQIGKGYHPAGTKGGVMVYVPAGEFWMGCNSEVDDECWSHEKPYHKVYLDAYFIDKYEVTVDEYRFCVEAGECEEPYSLYNWSNPGHGNHPINGVSWFDARDYCKFVGKNLPTEAEWEKAARGDDGRKYPWGNQDISCQYAVIRTKKGGCDRNSTWPVGSKPKGASPYGAMNMAGNVSEWTADFYDKNYYQNASSENPIGPQTGKKRTQRGGSWDSVSLIWTRSSCRGSTHPINSNSRAGFRCAKSVVGRPDQNLIQTSTLEEVEKEIFNLTNRARSEHGIHPYRKDRGLREAARDHCVDMINRKYVAHVSPEGHRVNYRIYTRHRRIIGSRVGENISIFRDSYQFTPSELAQIIVDGWMNSPHHRENMLHSSFTHLGVGAVTDGGEIKFTQNFARIEAYLDEPLPEKLTRGQPLSLKVTPFSDGLENATKFFLRIPFASKMTAGPFPMEDAIIDVEKGTYQIVIYFNKAAIFSGPLFEIE